MQQEYGEAIRGILAKQQAVQAIVNFKDNQVFRGATTYTCLLFLCKTATAQFLYSEVAELSAFVQTKQPTAQGNINSSEISSEPWMLASKGKGALLKKLSQFPRLESFAREIFVGLQTSADKVMIVEKIGEHPDGSLLMRSAAQQREYTFEPDILKPIISGADVKRYGHPVKHQFVLFPYHIANEKVTLIPEKELKANLPLTYKYLRANRDTLAGREQGRMDTASWYGYVYLKNMSKQEYRKLCVPRLVQRIQAVYDSEGEYYLDNVDVGGITLLDESNEAYKCMLGLLNSRLLTFFLCAISTPFRGGYYSCNKQYTSQLPIPPIPNRQQLTQLVSEMLTLHENLAATTSADARKLIQRQIAGTDKRIDALVYALYGLTAEEIAIVENVS